MNVPPGREDIARLFQNSISRDKLSQAYILSGDKGMGKKTIMRYILSLILCSGHTSCGSCPSCLSLEKGAHPDAVELKKDADKATLSVDNVRAIKGEVYTKPVMADYKVVIVYDMHLATPAAQNAMLKMIEEPPERVVFIMLCDTMSPILSTISSRSVVIDLKPLSADALRQIPSATDFEISVCEGNPGRLIRLRDDADYIAFRDEALDAFVSAFSEEPYAPYEAASRLDKLKANKEEILSTILMLARDAYYRSTGLDDRIINKDKINYINALCQKLTVDKIWRIMDYIITTEREKGKNGNFSMAVTVLLLKCRSEMKKQKGT